MAAQRPAILILACTLLSGLAAAQIPKSDSPAAAAAPATPIATPAATPDAAPAPASTGAPDAASAAAPK
ncbi:MAG: hypothetical protein ACRCS9_07690, partial [Hyphomicrobium sp.]